MATDRGVSPAFGRRVTRHFKRLGITKKALGGRLVLELQQLGVPDPSVDYKQLARVFAGEAGAVALSREVVEAYCRALEIPAIPDPVERRREYAGMYRDAGFQPVWMSDALYEQVFEVTQREAC